MSRVEFVALMAMLFSTIAFSIDAMLPAMPDIGVELSPDAPNRAQLIITSFVLGMGVGTLFTGPLSDAFGRKPVVVGGVLVYMAAALAAWLAPSLELLLAARVVQGLGAAGPRVVAIAIIRDRYSGRQMAQLISFVMVVFNLVPALAPAIGAMIIAGFGWRAIFLAFVVFAGVSAVWMTVRQPETLAPEARRPFRLPALAAGVVEVVSNRQVTLTIAVQSLIFGTLFSMLSTIQPLFDLTFGNGESFPFWFAVIAVVAGLGSILNARIVMRLGMRRVVQIVLRFQIVASLAMLAVWMISPAASAPVFAAFVLWAVGVFLMATMTLGNLNALAMEPMGHLAGTAASVIGAISTVAAVAIAVPVGQAFDGTPVPVILGVLVCTGLSLVLMRGLREASAAGMARPGA